VVLSLQTYAASRPASAHPANGVDLSWTAPDGCPDAAYVTSYLERLLGRHIEPSSESAIRAVGTVRKNEVGNWELAFRISVSDRVAEEVLVASKCRALADATVLKTALAADPLAVVDAIEARPASGAGGTASGGSSGSPAGEPPLALSSVGFVPAPEPTLVRLRVEGVGIMGPMPALGRGGGVYASLQHGRVRFELGGEIAWGGETRSSSAPSVGAHLSLISGAARTCLLLPREGRWSVPICGGFELGVMHGAGFGAAVPESAQSLWGAAVVGPAVRFSASRRWALWVELDAVVPLIRPGFYVENLGTLYVAPAAGTRGAVGLEVDFGD
jgi:hypothetical protein